MNLTWATLSITVILFLVALQFIQTVNASGYATVPIVIGFGAAAIISLSFFIMIVDRTAEVPSASSRWSY
jgi:hypothetical protein